VDTRRSAHLNAFLAEQPEYRNLLMCSGTYKYNGAADVERTTMTYPRKAQVSLKETNFYHVSGRCVRQSWLWGFDAKSERDYSHRKQWVLDRLEQQSRAFTIDICAYAIMCNHYHLVVRIDRDRALALSAREVVDQWSVVYGRPVPIQRWCEGTCSEEERELAEATIAIWRERLCDLSWYMRALNEHLARRANEEDGCKGKFWEGRYRSQALLENAGLLTAMVYVDLNPVRAQAAATPEESEFASIFPRIQTSLLGSTQPQGGAARENLDPRTSVPLMRFADETGSAVPSIPFSLRDYLQLVDWTGRAVRADKSGAIDADLPPIFERLKVDPQRWTRMMRPRGNVFGRAIGRLERMRMYAKALKQSRVRGMGEAKRLYGAC
jgi:hypothetical protein